MAVHKRKATDDRSNGSRKRQCSPSAPALVVKEQKLNSDDFVAGLNRFAQKTYNKYVPFCDKPCAGDATRLAAARVQERFSEMQRIFDNASERLYEQMEGLDDDVESFVEVSHEREMWWMSGNVLDLPIDEIDKALERHPPRDTTTLEEYIRGILPSETSRFRQTLPWLLKQEHQEAVDKALRLISTFYSLESGQRYAVHAYADYVSVVLVVLKSGRVQYALYNQLLTELCRGLRGGSQYVAEYSLRTLARISRGEDRLERRRHQQPSMDVPLIARKLEQAYQASSKQCSDSDREGKCPHTAMADALEYVQKEAYGEVRGKVMITVGTILPPELTKEVLLYALAAEALPVEIKSYRRDGGLKGIIEKDYCPMMSKIKEEQKRKDRMRDRMEVHRRRRIARSAGI